jgi:selenocysteine lyase/cysteine desulfurase
MTDQLFGDLERSVVAALETYSNVHRGSGHNSIVSTHLYEKAREIVLQYLGLNSRRYAVVFCTPAREAALKALLQPDDYKSASSRDIGLPLGVRALAVKRKALPAGTPFQTGGGTTRIISPDWVVWAGKPDRLEAGTPAIVSVIAFAKALQLIRQYGNEAVVNPAGKQLTAREIIYSDELEDYSGRELLDKLRQTLLGRGLMVPTTEGAKPFINLDNSASTPTFMPVWNAVRLTWHQPAQVQQDIVDEVRSVCSRFLGAPETAYDVIFTSNTTEAINMAAESLCRETGKDTEPVLLNTLLEHSSNDLPWRKASRYPLLRLAIDADGFADLNQLETLLQSYNRKGEHGKRRITLVAVSGASNVLGTVNDLAELSRIVHLYGARLLVDAAQLAAHRKVEMKEWGIDYLAFSGHKVYAPFGCGALVVKKGLLKFTSPEMDLIRSSGEENTGGIAALGKALVLLQRIGMEVIRKEEQVLTARALHGLAHTDGIKVHGIKDPDSPAFAHKLGVIAFEVKGALSGSVAAALAERGAIGVRYGCHCAHILVKHLVGVPPSLEWIQRLLAILVPRLRFPGLARVSLGIENREEDIDTFLAVLGSIIRQRHAPGQSPSMPKAVIKRQINDFVRASTKRVYSEC